MNKWTWPVGSLEAEEGIAESETYKAYEHLQHNLTFNII